MSSVGVESFVEPMIVSGSGVGMVTLVLKLSWESGWDMEVGFGVVGNIRVLVGWLLQSSLSVNLEKV